MWRYNRAHMRYTLRSVTIAFLFTFGLAFLSAGLIPRTGPRPPEDTLSAPQLVEAMPASTVSSPPAATPELPPPPMSVLDAYRIISYYGHPQATSMGVLGEGPPEAVYERLTRQAAAYAAADPERPVKLAFHFIYAVAQADPGPDGLFLRYTEDALVRSYINFTRDHNMLIFLDLQNGRADLEQEVQQVLPYLHEPHVHLAIDPEFTMPPGKRPGINIGSVTGAQVNRVQEVLQGFILEHRLGNKILIVHQFLDEMVWDKESIASFDRVDLVFDMDGFGGADAKRSKYYRYAVPPPGEYQAIKLFYQWDTDLMSPTSVLSLDPMPDIIIYQ